MTDVGVRMHEGIERDGEKVAIQDDENVNDHLSSRFNALSEQIATPSMH